MVSWRRRDTIFVGGAVSVRHLFSHGGVGIADVLYSSNTTLRRLRITNETGARTVSIDISIDTQTVRLHSVSQAKEPGSLSE